MIAFTLASRGPLLNSALATLSGYLLDVAPRPNSRPFSVFRLPNKLLSLDSSGPASKHLMLSFVISPLSLPLCPGPLHPCRANNPCFLCWLLLSWAQSLGYITNLGFTERCKQKIEKKATPSRGTPNDLKDKTIS